MQPMNRRILLIIVTLLAAPVTARAGDVYFLSNLVSNDQSVVQAQQTDPNLINPWGISFSTTSPLWVSDQAQGANGSANATVYRLTGLTSTPPLLTVPVPNDGGAMPSDNNGPTGQVSTGAAGITTQPTDFQVSGGKANFIFANLDGSIEAWHGGMSTAKEVVLPAQGASFTGLAIGNTSGGAAQIYAADQNSPNVYAFNSSWTKVATLTDPSLPSGFTAFNVQNIHGMLYVTYAIPNTPLGGVVDVFTTDGALVGRLITDTAGTHLDTPWGIALAPAGWGKFGGDLLIGNNDGDGTINAYTPGGVWQGQIMLGTGLFTEGELWGMAFGNGGGAGSPDVLYFAAGLPGATNGLIGAISAPEPSSAVLGLIALGAIAGGWRWKNRWRPVVS
jgi:uncharacterized protein (TIGR03118 family)